MKRRDFIANISCFATGVGVTPVFARDRIAEKEEILICKETALELLELIDSFATSQSNITRLYQSAGEALHQRYSAKSYSERLQKVRTPLGAVKAREFGGFSGPFYSLPNIIAGDYIIMVYNTQFLTQTVKYSEQITLEKDISGGTKPRFVEYYIGPIKAEE